LPCSSKGIQGKQPKQRDLHLASGWQRHETHAMHRKLKFTIRVVSLTVQFLLWQSQWVFQPLCKVDHSVHMRIGSETTWRRSLGSLRCIYHFRAYQMVRKRPETAVTEAATRGLWVSRWFPFIRWCHALKMSLHLTRGVWQTKCAKPWKTLHDHHGYLSRFQEWT
jgi:hypothetical protein